MHPDATCRQITVPVVSVNELIYIKLKEEKKNDRSSVEIEWISAIGANVPKATFA